MRLEDIKRVRHKLGLTQKGLSELSGVSQSAIAKIESETMQPTYESAQKIFEALESAQHKESVKARNIMIKSVQSISSEKTVHIAAEKMKKYEISQLPVFEKGHLIGLISEETIAENFGTENIGKKNIKEIMKDAPPTIAEEAPIKIIAELLKYSPIVLVYRKAELSGVITKADLLKTI